jgi:hypothetical protein
MMIKKAFSFVALTAAMVTLGTTEASSRFVQKGYASVIAGSLNCFTFPATCFESANPNQTVFVPGSLYLVRNINNSGVDKWATIDSKSVDEEGPYEIEFVPQDCDKCTLAPKGE